MNRQELKDALRDLALCEPDFMRDLIGEVIKEHLSVDSVSNGDFYNPKDTYALKWKDTEYDNTEFSRAY